jgi:hypothetical protein
MLEACGRPEQLRNLVGAQNDGQGTRVLDRMKLAGKIRSINRVREEEAQRRNDAVHRRHAQARIALFDLE